MPLLRKFADCPNCPQAPLVNPAPPAPAPIPPMKAEPPVGAARKAVPAASLAKIADGETVILRDFGASAGALCKLAAVQIVMEKGPDGSYVDSGRRVEGPDVKRPRVEKTMKKAPDGSYVVDEGASGRKASRSGGGEFQPTSRGKKKVDNVLRGMKSDLKKYDREYREAAKRTRAAERAMRNGMLAAGAIGVPLAAYGAYRAFRRDD